MGRLNFKRLLPNTARQYEFYQLPKLLIDHRAFDGIDYGAKILYSLMLNRAGLSASYANVNDFTDEDGYIYIIYTVEQVMDTVRCSKPTAIKMIKQLEDIGLIDKRKQGQGKPAIIYVNDFSSAQEILPDDYQKKIKGKSDELQEVKNVDNQKSKSFTSRSQKSELQGVKDIDNQKSKTLTTRSQSGEPQEVKGVDSIYNNTNYPDNSNNNPILSHHTSAEKKDIKRPFEIDYDTIRQEVKEQVNYNYLKIKFNDDMIVDGICDIITDTMASTREYIKISGEQRPIDEFRRRLALLDCEDISRLIYDINGVDTEIRNITNYVLQSLWNLKSTEAVFYSNQVNSNGVFGT
jgi:DNA-binding transcriptional regulator GbsR (MarR family)